MRHTNKRASTAERENSPSCPSSEQCTHAMRILIGPRCVDRQGALRVGSGGTAPAFLDTVGTTPPGDAKPLDSGHSNESAHGHAGAVCPGFAPPRRGRRVAPLFTPSGCASERCAPERCASRTGRACASASTWKPRAPEGRGARASWRRYAARVAEELSTLGHTRTAERLRACGTLCEVRACHSCGDPFARVRVLVGCDVRACVLCARVRAARETARVSAAADRIADLARVKGAGALAATERELARRGAQERRTVARERDCARLRRVAGELRACLRGGWSWRMVTISPPWDPSQRASYSPAALAERLDAVRAAWSRVWSDHLSSGGHAAAYVSVEISAGGHVHLHALHFGAWVSQASLARSAGCMVDVRAARGDAVREVVKYALKGPSPRGAWIAGTSSETPHPRLAAAWCAATRGRRLVEPYGIFREALHTVDELDELDELDEREADERCASCGAADLGSAVKRLTAECARESLEIGRRAGKPLDRWSLRAEVAARGGPPPLPARVSMARG